MMKEYWSSLASLLGVLAFCQSLLHVIFPPELRFATVKLFNKIFHVFSTYCFFEITEIDGVNTNELYNAIQLYLSSSVSISGSRLSLTRAVNSSAITFGLSNNDSIHDSFNGVKVLWEHVVLPRQTQTFSWRPLPEEKRGFTLRIRKKDKTLILNSYLDYIMDRANEIRRKNQDRLLYTNSRGGSLDSRGHPWESVPFKHPSTFETLAMDPEKKKEIMEDLQDFANGMSFYQKTGRAWKRGYLLYGPPGTGKSSMIAAMANFLSYDIYDLELTEVHTNSELRKLLMKTSSKSIIVIEDIDCSIHLTNRKKNNANMNKTNNISSNPGSRSHYEGDFRYGYGANCGEMEGNNGSNGNNSITLSGLLNFTDGLWSCCGSERIFVFTTNHIEKLDPALLRSGRMDMHIYMSYCSYPSLKILLKNYLGFGVEKEEEDKGSLGILKELEGIIVKAEMTPADISEVLIKNRRNKGKALKELLEALKMRVEKKNVNNNRKRRDRIDDEDEEQEKRALECSNNGGKIEDEEVSSDIDEDEGQICKEKGKE